MRRIWFVWLGVGACSSTPRTEAPLAPEAVIERRVAVVPDTAPDAFDPDPDHDNLVGECDLCPNAAETYNGILDEDGCPDTSGASHAVIEDPTNRFGFPLRVVFRGDQPTEKLPRSFLDEPGIEVIDVIARSSTTIKPAVASKRAATIAKGVRAIVLESVRVEEHITGASRVYVDDDFPIEDSVDVYVQVMRARTVQIWKWEDDHLVRATPRARLPVPKLPAGC